MDTRIRLISILFSLLISGYTFTLLAQADLSDTWQWEGYSEKEGMTRKSVTTMNPEPLLLDYDVKFYGLDVEVDNQSDQIQGSVTVLVQVQNNPLSTFVLELANSLEVDLVEVNGKEQSFTHQDEELRITLGTPVVQGQYIAATIYYGGQTGEGMVSEVDGNWGVPVTFTLSEPFYAKDWFPCKENLEDKADSVHVFITTDYGLKGVSQGILTGTTYFPNGKVRHEWKSNYPIAFYLISVAVADYTEYNIEVQPAGHEEPILIQNFVYDVPGCLDAYREKINVTADIMEVYCEHFGPYPFSEEKYGHYLWPWGGGMEHQTMTGMGNFEFYLVAHELGHSWFGDYVTCETWQDIWINEGFATFAGYLATEVLGPEYAAGEREYRFGSALSEPDGTVYVPLADADNDPRIFSGSLSYNKGMALIYMIRYELQDDDLFFRVLRNFLDRYRNDVATGMDFKNILEETTGKDFTDFFDQWYFGAGYPIYEVTWDQQGEELTIHSLQTTSSGITPLFKMTMEYRIYYEGGDTTIRVFHGKNDENYLVDIPYAVDTILIDPDNQVLNKVTGVEKTAHRKENEEAFIIYPNPTKGEFSFLSHRENREDVTLEIYNQISQLVYSGRFEGCMPFSPYRVDPGSLTKGIYMIRLAYENSVEIKMIIVE